MKILNLYAGIGGNRKLWGNDHDITAVEYDKITAQVYQDFYPNDKVIIGDAHDYLLQHFREYDFIWSSPPCPTHSRMRLLCAVQEGKKFKFPDMALYQQIIFLKHFFKGKYCVENVITYYDPLVVPKKLGNHYYWANFNIGNFKETPRDIIRKTNDEIIEDKSKKFGFDFSKHTLTKTKRSKMLNNCVEPETGLYILNCAMDIIINQNIEQTTLF